MYNNKRESKHDNNRLTLPTFHPLKCGNNLCCKVASDCCSNILDRDANLVYPTYYGSVVKPFRPSDTAFLNTRPIFSDRVQVDMRCKDKTTDRSSGLYIDETRTQSFSMYNDYLNANDNIHNKREHMQIVENIFGSNNCIKVYPNDDSVLSSMHKVDTMHQGVCGNMCVHNKNCKNSSNRYQHDESDKAVCVGSLANYHLKESNIPMSWGGISNVHSSAHDVCNIPLRKKHSMTNLPTSDYVDGVNENERLSLKTNKLGGIGGSSYHKYMMGCNLLDHKNCSKVSTSTGGNDVFSKHRSFCVSDLSRENYYSGNKIHVDLNNQHLVGKNRMVKHSESAHICEAYGVEEENREKFSECLREIEKKVKLHKNCEVNKKEEEVNKKTDDQVGLAQSCDTNGCKVSLLKIDALPKSTGEKTNGYEKMCNLRKTEEQPVGNMKNYLLEKGNNQLNRNMDRDCSLKKSKVHKNEYSMKKDTIEKQLEHKTREQAVKNVVFLQKNIENYMNKKITKQEIKEGKDCSLFLTDAIPFIPTDKKYFIGNDNNVDNDNSNRYESVISGNNNSNGRSSSYNNDTHTIKNCKSPMDVNIYNNGKSFESKKCFLLMGKKIDEYVNSVKDRDEWKPIYRDLKIAQRGSSDIKEKQKLLNCEVEKIKIDFLFEHEDARKTTNELVLPNMRNNAHLNDEHKKLEESERATVEDMDNFCAMGTWKNKLVVVDRYFVERLDGSIFGSPILSPEDLEIMYDLSGGKITFDTMKRRGYKLTKVEEYHSEEGCYEDILVGIERTGNMFQLVSAQEQHELGSRGNVERKGFLIEVLRKARTDERWMWAEMETCEKKNLEHIDRYFKRLKINVKWEDLQELKRIRSLFLLINQLGLWRSKRSMIYLEEECSENENVIYDHQKMRYRTKENSDIKIFKRNCEYDSLLDVYAAGLTYGGIRVIRQRLFVQVNARTKVYTNIYKFVLINRSNISIFYIDDCLVLSRRDLVIQNFISKGSFGVVYRGILRNRAYCNNRETEKVDNLELLRNNEHTINNRLEKDGKAVVGRIRAVDTNHVNYASIGQADKILEYCESEFGTTMSKEEQRAHLLKTFAQQAVERARVLSSVREETTNESQYILEMWKQQRTFMFFIDQKFKERFSENNDSDNFIENNIVCYLKNSSDDFFKFSLETNRILFDVVKLNINYKSEVINIAQIVLEVEMLYAKMTNVNKKFNLDKYRFDMLRHLLAERYYNVTVYKNKGQPWCFDSSKILTLGIQGDRFYFFDKANVFHYNYYDLIFKIVLSENGEDSYEGVKSLSFFSVLGLNDGSNNPNPTGFSKDRKKILDGIPDLKSKLYRYRHGFSKLKIIPFSKINMDHLEHALVYCFLKFIFSLQKNAYAKKYKSNTQCKVVNGVEKTNESNLPREAENVNGEDGRNVGSVGNGHRCNDVINLDGDIIITFNQYCNCHKNDNQLHTNVSGKYKKKENKKVAADKLKREKNKGEEFKYCNQPGRNTVSNSEKTDKGVNESKNETKKIEVVKVKENVGENGGGNGGGNDDADKDITVQYMYQSVKHPREFVAVKVHDLETSVNIKNFLRELEIYKNVNYSNICKFHGIRIQKNTLMLVLEYCPLGNLFNFLKNNKKIPKHQRLQWSIELAKIVHQFHSHIPPIVNADIKTSNILINNNMNLVMCDFGKARFKHSTLYSNFGSYRYMAPESFDSYSIINEKVDIWSLACCITEIFTGNYPFHKINKVANIRQELLSERVPTVPTFLPGSIQKVLKEAFSIDPNDRPTAYEIYKGLKKIKVMR